MGIKVKRSMLQGKYKWQAAGNAGGHDAHLFNRREGYEVLKMIQAVAERLGLETEADVHRVEKLIADELPGDVRSWERVEDWLLVRLAPENSAITYVKSLANGLGFSMSESGRGPEFFSMRIPSADNASDALLLVARSADYVSSYGTSEDYDPTKDYYDLESLEPLYPNLKSGPQGFIRELDMDEDGDLEQLQYNPEGTEEYESIGPKIVEKFYESTTGVDGLAIFCYPERYQEGSGVFMMGGIDPPSGRLVGFMIQNVLT